MQRATPRFISQQKITFGNTRAQRRYALQISLLVCGLAAIVCDVSTRMFQGPHYLLLWLIWGVWLAWLLTIFYYFEALCLDFNIGIYTFEKGIFGDNVRDNGRLTDIDHVYLEQTIDKEGKTFYRSWLVFRPDLHRESLLFRGLHYPLTAELFESQMTVILETAARLNVPVHDASGWRGSWRSPSINPETVIIPPGEAHPATLLPPPKKW